MRLSGRYNGLAYAVFPPRASAAPRRCCATAITMVASQRPLQRSRLCSLSAAGLGRPASLLRDGHYNGRVSAAVKTASPMQSCFHVVSLGRSKSWASNERACQSVPASRAEGELHHQQAVSPMLRRGPRPPRVVAARRPLRLSRLGGHYNGLAYAVLPSRRGPRPLDIVGIN